jgi:putative RNA 2'-phosphotransferase
MSLILRHQPEVIGIILDPNGWADTEALISGMKRTGRQVTLEQIKEVVATSDKQRFKFNEDCTKIRANQGHSVLVDVELQQVEPPDLLYHGTATRFVQDIKKQGLISKSRLHVHLSMDVETAYKVGNRHGMPVILVIDSGQMHKDGFAFYLSENGVWLTANVPARYISEQN